MTDRLNLLPRYRDELQALLCKHVPDAEVWAYGSRVNGQGHEVSDLDLALRGPNLEPLGHEYGELVEALEQSDIPILVQAHDWARLPESFQREIERDYVVLKHNGRTTPQRDARENWLYRPAFPAHWNRCSLLSMAQWVNGLAFRNIQFSPTGKPVIKIAEIKGGISGQTKFTHQEFDESVRVRPGDLLFSWSGQPETSIDAFWWHGPEGWLNQHVFRVTTNQDIDSTFFFYLLRYLKPNFIGIARNKQTTGLGHVTRRDLESIEGAFPPLSEQRAISGVLGALDDKIELNRRMNQTLEAMARAIFQDWFVDFGPVRARLEGREPYLPPELQDLFPDRLADSELGEIPEGWAVKALGAIVDVVGGTTPSTKIPEYWDGGIHCWATPKDLSGLSVPVLLGTERKITDSGLKRIGSGLQPKGTVLLSSRAPIGYLAINEVPVAINQGFIAMRPRQDVSNLYLLYWCKSSLDEVVSHANGSTFLEISKSNFRQIPLTAPGPATLNAYHLLVSNWYGRMVVNERSSRTLAAQRDALLPKLVSGELRVADAEVEIGSRPAL